MADPASLFADLPAEAVATAAIVEMLGGGDAGAEVVQMLLGRRGGQSLSQLADRFDLPRTTLASRLEVAEAKVERARAMAERLAHVAKGG